MKEHKPATWVHLRKGTTLSALVFGVWMWAYDSTPEASGGEPVKPGRPAVQESQKKLIPRTWTEEVEKYGDRALRSERPQKKRFANRDIHKGLEEGLTPEEKAKLNKKYKKWEKLSPDEKKELRKKMKKLKTLPPHDRQLYEDRFEQWKRLPPEERREIREKLDKKNGLSPKEQEEIRKKFKKGSE